MERRRLLVGPRVSQAVLFKRIHKPCHRARFTRLVGEACRRGRLLMDGHWHA